MEIIVLIIIISLLAVILFIALKKLIENITDEAGKYYFKKVQDYDAKLLEKEKELAALDTNSKEEEKVKNNERVIETSSVDKEFLNVINTTDYETLNALKIANKVDEIFKIDEEKILKKFLQKINVNENYKIYEMLRARFSPNLIYKLKMLNKDAQISAINKMLSDEEYEVFNSYVKTRKFKLEKFLLDLDLLIENNMPFIEVIVGNHSKNYNYLSPYIKTTYSDDIYKGMIIKYQDRIYDYSINERDV